MLRILHISPYSPDAWAYGGIPRLTGTLTREMARQGHRVTLCATDVCDASGRLPSTRRGASGAELQDREATEEAVDQRIFPNLSNKLAYRCQFFTPIGLGPYLRKHAREFDVAHLHACRNLPGVIAAYHLTKAGVPYVLAPNGTGARLERFFFTKRAFDLAAGNRVMRGAARVLAVSQAERRQLRALGVPEKSVCTIPNPVDLDEFSPSIARGAFRGLHRLGQAPIVMFLGKLTPRKGVGLLLRAFAGLDRSDARLVVAGNDMGAGREAIALAHSLGLTNRTLFTGLLEGRRRLEAMADADLVVYPSEHEIFGLVPLEALLCGTPVIVADDSGCGEIIRSAGGGDIVPVGDVEALTRAIIRVLNAPDAWRARARDAAVRVRAEYGGSAVSARVVTMYRSLVADS